MSAAHSILAILELIDVRLLYASLLLFIVLLLPVTIVVHELGHAVFARLAGLRILTVGIGYRQVFCRMWIGQTCFYVGRPLLTGLCLCQNDDLIEQPRKVAFFVAGGPVFTLLGALAMFGAWHMGIRNVLVVALLCSLLLNSAFSIFPAQISLQASVLMRETDVWRQNVFRSYIPLIKEGP